MQTLRFLLTLTLVKFRRGIMYKLFGPGIQLVWLAEQEIFSNEEHSQVEVASKVQIKSLLAS